MRGFQQTWGDVYDRLCTTSSDGFFFLFLDGYNAALTMQDSNKHRTVCIVLDISRTTCEILVTTTDTKPGRFQKLLFALVLAELFFRFCLFVGFWCYSLNLQFEFTRNLGQSLHVITSLDMNSTLIILPGTLKAIMEPSRGFILWEEIG